MKLLIRVAWQDRKLMNRVFVFVFGMSVDSIQRNNHLISIDAARGRASIENRDVGERAYHHEILNVPFAQKILQLTAEKLIKSIGIDNRLVIPALERRRHLLHRSASGVSGNRVNDRHPARPRGFEKASERFHQLRADFLGIVTARAEIEDNNRRLIDRQADGIRLGPVWTILLSHLSVPPPGPC